MVKIEFPLPFRLPIEDDLKIVSAYDNVADFHVVFKHKKQNNHFEDVEHGNLYEITIAMVEYSPNYQFENVEDIDDIFHYAVANTIWYLNHFIDALRIVLDDINISNFSIADLPEVVKIEYKEENFIYVTHPLKLIGEKRLASGNDIKRALKVLATWDLHPNIEIVDKFFDKAKYHLAKEEFIFVVVELQTSFEAFIRNSYRLILTKRGSDNEEIERAYKIPFKNVIEQNLAKYLKVNLSCKEEGVIKNWYVNLYSLRNQIVHSGRLVISGDDAYKAYDSYIEARNYLSDLLVNEGYLSKDGKVDLRIFIKNTKDNNDNDLVIERLIKEGFLPTDSNVIKE